MGLRVIDLDGSLTSQSTVWNHCPQLISASDWGPKIRISCSNKRFQDFERVLADRIGSLVDPEPQVSLYGSGDFHHVTLALLRRLTTPFNLFIIDKHPDWMVGMPFLHCGTWVSHALQLPGLQNVFHLGGDLDFDNSFRWLAPWKALRSRKVTVFPAINKYRRGAWRNVPNHALRPDPATPLTASRLRSLLEPHGNELAHWPLYITLDKDVLQEEFAAVNWDSGRLNLTEVRTILEIAGDMAGGRLAGMDILGDWSPVRVDGFFRTFWHLTEHPNQTIDPGDANRRNEKTNRSILSAHAPGLKRSLFHV